jgi:hypothetical protein
MVYINYHDGIAICCAYGPPDLFITCTFNSKWPEITTCLLLGEHPNDRHDIIVCVFHMKLQLLDDLQSGKVFGIVLALLYSIESQKRGLPHVHILIRLDKKGCEIIAKTIDLWISAEIPDPELDPLGYALVAEHMMHGQCRDKNRNYPCMKKANVPNFTPKILKKTLHSLKMVLQYIEEGTMGFSLEEKNTTWTTIGFCHII